MSISRKLKNASSGAADGGGSAGGYGDDVFSTYLYTGDGTQYRDIENGIDLAGEGGLVWIKDRLLVRNHTLFDTERGAKYYLFSDTNDKQNHRSSSSASFNSNGFTVSDGDGGQTNFNGRQYASWTFRKAPKFFDVVTYTGDGDPYREVPHNLGVSPGMVMVKRTDSTSDWVVTNVGWAQSNGGMNGILRLNSDEAKVPGGRTQHFTDTTFSVVGNSTDLGIPDEQYTNIDGGEYVAYVFAHDDSDESLIKCGSYTGNQTAGNEVDLGFEPQFVLIKAVSGAGDWCMFDTMRGIVTGGFDPFLRANMNAAESASSEQLEVNPTGFSLSVDINVNKLGIEYIYMAIRRPNKPAEEFEPEELFAVDNTQTGGKDPRMVSGFPVDFAFRTQTGSSDSRSVGSRMAQGTELVFNTTAADRARTQHQFDYMDGWLEGDYAAWTSWMWRRAPGFFDVVCYEGTPTGSIDGMPIVEIPHNLGVVPELKIIKVRNTDFDWLIGGDVVRNIPDPNYSGPDDNRYGWGSFLYLTDGKAQHASGFWMDEDTDNVLIHSGISGNQGGAGYDYIAYLFASVPGISKIGSYTGNGTEQEIDCGFTNGARWLLIKKVNDSGDWYVTSDPSRFSNLVKLNTTEAQSNYTSTFNDVPSGFRVTGSAGNLNDNDDQYIFYALA